ALFYEFSLERHVPRDAPAAVDRQVRRTRRSATGSGSVLQRERSAFDRPGAADPDVARRLLLRHPLGTAAMRRSASEPRLSLVLPARARRLRAGPFDLFQEPPRAASATATCCGCC